MVEGGFIVWYFLELKPFFSPQLNLFLLAYTSVAQPLCFCTRESCTEKIKWNLMYGFYSVGRERSLELFTGGYRLTENSYSHCSSWAHISAVALWYVVIKHFNRERLWAGWLSLSSPGLCSHFMTAAVQRYDTKYTWQTHGFFVPLCLLIERLKERTIC